MSYDVKLESIVKDDSGQLVALCSQGHFKSMERLTSLIIKGVSYSFKIRPMKANTVNEVKRRFGIALEFTKQLRFDVGWSIQRIEDELGNCIVFYLDGGTNSMVVPEECLANEHKMWFPSDDVPEIYVPDGDESDWLETE